MPVGTLVSRTWLARSSSDSMLYLAMSERAWAAYERSDLPKFYLDLGKYRKAAKGDSCFSKGAVVGSFSLLMAIHR